MNSVLSMRTATPNPSFEARSNGKPPGPGRWYAYIFTGPGLASCRWSRLNSNVRPHTGAPMSLELRIPPPVVALLVAAAMWLASAWGPGLELTTSIRITLTIIIAMPGVLFSLAGMISFRRAQTTMNPMSPERASALVSSGIYAITRNPMYVGLLLDLLSWAVFLSSPLALAGPLAYFFYIQRFQIQPEERILARMFGAEYAEYQSKVRRWL